MWRDKKTGAVVTRHDQIRAARPYTTLPAQLTREWIDAVEFEEVTPADEPTYDPMRQRLEPGDPALVDGKWQQHWYIVDLTQDEIDAKVTMALTTADTARAAKWEEIKQLRTKHEYGGVEVEGKWFHTDADSRIKYLALKDKARDALAAGAVNTDVLKQLGGNILWKTLDNSFAPMTVALAMALPEAVANLDAMAFTKAEQHRVALNAAANPVDYDFSTGWPATYLEAQ